MTEQTLKRKILDVATDYYFDEPESYEIGYAKIKGYIDDYVKGIVGENNGNTQKGLEIVSLHPKLLVAIKLIL